MYQDTAYGDYQEEMDRFNLAFCDVMLEGDAKGRVFTFPIPTINITQGFRLELRPSSISSWRSRASTASRISPTTSTPT